MRTVMLVRWQREADGRSLDGYMMHGAISVLLPEDQRDFDAEAPYGYTLDEAQAVEGADGRWYPMVRDCPAGGVERWTLAAHDAKAAEHEAAVMAIPPEHRERFAPGFVAVADRKAKRAADDAAAEERRAKKAADDAAAHVAAEAALEARIQAAAARLVAEQGAPKGKP